MEDNFIADVILELDKYEPREYHNVEGISQDDALYIMEEYENKLRRYRMLSGEMFNINSEEDLVEYFCSMLQSNHIEFKKEHSKDSVLGRRMDVYLPGYGIAVEAKHGFKLNKIRTAIGQCISYDSAYDFVDSVLVLVSADMSKSKSYQREKINNVIPMVERADMGLAVLGAGKLCLYNGEFEHRLLGVWDDKLYE